jgi:hypothetical protein
MLISPQLEAHVGRFGAGSHGLEPVDKHRAGEEEGRSAEIQDTGWAAFTP